MSPSAVFNPILRRTISIFPTAVDPVKEILRTIGLEVRAPPIAGPLDL
jgi:hypothetical protein